MEHCRVAAYTCMSLTQGVRKSEWIIPDIGVRIDAAKKPNRVALWESTNQRVISVALRRVEVSGLPVAVIEGQHQWELKDAKAGGIVIGSGITEWFGVVVAPDCSLVLIRDQPRRIEVIDMNVIELCFRSGDRNVYSE